MKKEISSYNVTNTLLFNLEQTARIARISAIHYFEETKEIDISYNDFSILDAIFLNPEISQTELAKLLAKDTANLSRDLDRLEKKQYIERTVDTKANRIVKKTLLTECGIKLHEKITNITKSQIEKLESVFNEKEKEQFKNYLIRLKNNISDNNL